MLLLFYCIENKKRGQQISTNLKIKSVPSRPIRIQSKAYGELFLSANQLLLSAGGTWLFICANIRTCTSNANFTYYLGYDLFNLVAGGGFEHSDLRVMSPASYQLLYPTIYFVLGTGFEPVNLQNENLMSQASQTNRVYYLVEMSGVEPESTKMLMILFYQVAQDLKFWTLQPIATKGVDCILDGQSIPVRILG